MTDIDDIILGNGIHLAPLAGITDPAMRLLCRHFGAGPMMTEMVTAHGVGCGRNHLLEEQLPFAKQEAPLSVQIVGSDPAIMADVARLAQERGADSINLNMACPARKVTKSGKGCAMMQQMDLSAQVMKAVKGAVKVPVTVKIRAGWNHSELNCVEYSKMAEDCGMAMVILHPRTRRQAFSGKSDWTWIEKTVNAVSIPVVGNGDIKSPEDAERMLRTTGCAGIMIGRAALGRPWLFAQVVRHLQAIPELLPIATSKAYPSPLAGTAPDLDLGLLTALDPAEMGKVVRLHIDLAARLETDKKLAQDMRKNLIWYSKGLHGSAEFRSRISTVVDRPSLDAMAEGFFR